jgi:DNA-binding response OmpR family regulator
VRVLVADDEDVVREGVAAVLRAAGYEVNAVADGTAALEMLRGGGLHAAILDVRMPGANGYVVCRTVRHEEIWTPIMMLTAKAGELDEVEAFEFGADDYLSKPFSAAVLTARLASMIRIGERPRRELLAYGDITFDPLHWRCRVRDQSLRLSPRESALLEVLLRAHGDSVSKTRLFDEVWGSSHPASISVVEVYVGYLRRKLAAVPSDVRIETVRGIGYHLV